ncbi:hypothetical protein [Microbulbifer pacificus]|uniref:Uncharacterized protein n=1 Tax=Microbulbifer pacificus TaxID=407164 RepID=A0AAU0N3C0_9GAMM|nr:hypothetical protein [Microbulbifer pacificus]WOX06992.1 hypothetical protein R5R33_07630 [Microbulbifer pacificus]
MSAAVRNEILLEILQELRDEQIVVTRVRDELAKRAPATGLDRAALRRWVNSKFASFARKGWLDRFHFDGSNRVYFLAGPNLPNYSTTPRNPKSKSDFAQTEESLPSQSSSISKQLMHELSQHSLSVVSQLSEIEEYKRIRDSYPELREMASARFNAAVDENCRTLGKVKALESLIEKLGNSV